MKTKMKGWIQSPRYALTSRSRSLTASFTNSARVLYPAVCSSISESTSLTSSSGSLMVTYPSDRGMSVSLFGGIWVLFSHV